MTERALDNLPTLHRNALRRRFGRRHFTPAEVAELGYRSLARTEGIGRKRLGVIVAWLARHGFVLEAAGSEGSLFNC